MATPVTHIEDRIRRSKGRPSRDRMASARVTIHELRELENAAKADGKALGEWAREVLLKEARPQPSTQTILTELLQMRSLVEGLLAPLAIGQKLTPEQVNSIAVNAATKKHKLAADVLEQYRITGA